MDSGRIYQRKAIDTQANVGFAKVYLEKTALTAADLLNGRVLPFYDEHGLTVLRTLTDNGTEYRGRKDSHPYEFFLHLNDIEHTYIRVRHPQTNGSIERLNQTIQEKFYQVAFRKKLYTSLQEIQADLDDFRPSTTPRGQSRARTARAGPLSRPSSAIWTSTDTGSLIMG